MTEKIEFSMLDWFEEGKSRRFMSADKAEEELFKLFDYQMDEISTVLEQFWAGYRWQPPETKQKNVKKS